MYLLWPAGSGGYLHEASQFIARIGLDGETTFEDRRPRLSAKAVGKIYRRASDERPSLAESLERLARGTGDRRAPVDPPVCAHDPDPRQPLPAACRRGPGVIAVTGSFDFADESRVLTGTGWNREEKAMFLSATFAFRMKLAAGQREGQLAAAPGSLAPQLEAIWADARYTMRERKRIVCLLWSGLDPGDPERGRMAFNLLAWVRTRIPASSHYAYDGDELLACSVGGHAFKPYQ